MDMKAALSPSEIMYNILKDRLGREPELKDVPRIIMYMNEYHDDPDPQLKSYLNAYLYSLP